MVTLNAALFELVTFGSKVYALDQCSATFLSLRTGQRTQRVGTTISKTASFVKCSKAAAINVYRERISKQKTVFQRQSCGRHRLLEVQSERRIAKVLQSNRRVPILQIEGNLNQGATVNVSERTVRRTLHCVGYNLFGKLYCWL
ncbi:hypothetical protein TNCV_1806831 [Trichonephila clavipes]|nr:hypothetical protein TNCV_1806831 [Trichonephila clavipes]